MTEQSRKVGIAFSLTLIAGLSTAVGGSIVFFPRFVQYANRKTIASALGFSAGIMTYVSFAEIFNECKRSFEVAGFGAKRAYLFASLCFFGGVALMLVSYYIKDNTFFNFEKSFANIN
jgi:zinc transporter, ZIP family